MVLKLQIPITVLLALCAYSDSAVHLHEQKAQLKTIQRSSASSCPADSIHPATLPLAGTPGEILGDLTDKSMIAEPVVARALPNEQIRSKKMFTAVTPTHDKAFNKKPSMTQQSRIQQPK
jgi:hypothetical protein